MAGRTVNAQELAKDIKEGDNPMAMRKKYALIAVGVWFVVVAALIMLAKTDEPAKQGHITEEKGQLIYHTEEFGPGPPDVILNRVKEGRPSKSRKHN